MAFPDVQLHLHDLTRPRLNSVEMNRAACLAMLNVVSALYEAAYLVDFIRLPVDLVPPFKAIRVKVVPDSILLVAPAARCLFSPSVREGQQLQQKCIDGLISAWLLGLCFTDRQTAGCYLVEGSVATRAADRAVMATPPPKARGRALLASAIKYATSQRHIRCYNLHEECWRLVALRPVQL